MSTSRVDRRRWGDEDPEDEEYLPPPEETPVDENGIKQKIEYYRNEKGQTIRKITKIRVANVQLKVYNISGIRAKWEKFGKAATESTVGVTAVSNEDVIFENMRLQTKTLQQNKIENLQKNLQSADNRTIVAGVDELLKKKREERIQRLVKGDPTPLSEQSTEAAAKAAPSNKYVAPNLRSDAPPEDRYRRPGNENSVRVTNLSDDVDEDDLRDLFMPIGPISRIYLAVDKETNRSRGFAFVNFRMREDAERAIEMLNGYGYANLIIHCEWAAPKERR